MSFVASIGGLAFSCSGEAADSTGLALGHPGLGLDTAGLGMVERFAFEYWPASGRVEPEVVALVPVSQLEKESRWPVAPDWELQFLDGSGAVVHVEELHARPDSSGASQELSAHVRVRPAYERFRMSRGGQIVAEFAGSGAAPVLHSVMAHMPDLRFPVTYGKPAQVRFSWTACDPDAGTLTQSTYYAPSGAGSYRVIGQTTTEPQPDDPQTATTTAASDNGFVDYRLPTAADTSAPRVFNHLETPWNSSAPSAPTSWSWSPTACAGAQPHPKSSSWAIPPSGPSSGHPKTAPPTEATTRSCPAAQQTEHSPATGKDCLPTCSAGTAT